MERSREQLPYMHALFIGDIGQDGLCKFVVGCIRMGHIAVDRFKFPGNVSAGQPG